MWRSHLTEWYFWVGFTPWSVTTHIKNKGGFAHFHFYRSSKPLNTFLKRKKGLVRRFIGVKYTWKKFYYSRYAWIFGLLAKVRFNHTNNRKRVLAITILTDCFRPTHKRTGESFQTIVVSEDQRIRNAQL